MLPRLYVLVVTHPQFISSPYLPLILCMQELLLCPGWLVRFLLHRILRPHAPREHHCVKQHMEWFAGERATQSQHTTKNHDCLFTFQDSSWPIFFHGIAIVAASLSVIRGVATIEPVNKVIVPILLAIVAFSFYWALFLPSAADGIIHMFKPNWGRYYNVEQCSCGYV